MLALCCLLYLVGLGQDMKDGLYLSINDLKNNDPIPPTYLINELDIRNTDYLDRVVLLDTIRYYNRTEQERTILPNQVWGYCKNGNPYILFDDQFARIQVIGSVCHFTTIVEVRSYVSDPFDRMGMGREVITNQLMSNMIDLSTGSADRFNVVSMSTVLKRDPILWGEFEVLKKREKERKLFWFLTRYNERHVFQFGQ